MAKKETKAKESFLNFSISEELHEELRKLAFESRTSIAEICRHAIMSALNKSKKKAK